MFVKKRLSNSYLKTIKNFKIVLNITIFKKNVINKKMNEIP